MRKRWTDEQLIAAVSQSKSIAGVLVLLGLQPLGGNYKTMNNAIARLGLDTSHFTGQGWNKGDIMGLAIKNTRPLEEVLVLDSTYVSTGHLKKRLFKEGLKDQSCEICKLSEWLGKPIPLELDHVNGKSRDNRIENLQILCPNCHAQTDTYRGKNIGKAI